MIPSHLVFMHLNPAVGKEAETVIARLQNPFVKTIDISLIVGTMYHGGYGLISVLRDYLTDRSHQWALTILVTVLALIVTLVGIRLTVSV
jgi:succinate dehydrogenase hydrophobic anchor subunit